MMSISSQGGQQRRPSVVATGKKAPPAGKPADELDETDSSPEPDATPDAGSRGIAAESKTGSSSPASSKKGSSSAGSSAADSSSAGSSSAGSSSAGSSSAGSSSAGSKTTSSKIARRTGAAAKTGAAGAKAGGKAGARAGAGTRPGAAGKGAPAKGTGGKGGGPRRPITPVKVSQGRSWGPIALFTVVGLIAAGIIGWGAWAVYQNGRSWEDKANSINGIVDYRKTDPDMLARDHKPGTLQYKVTPPVGGDHNPTWQRCMGDVYDAQIPNENAVHSLEHGAVWITYQPDLPKDQVDKLASKVRGKDFLLMSPYPGLDEAISLQAWGYQLKVDNANDGRIDEFISALRENASLEPGTPCSSGNYTTGTGTTPRDLTEQQQGTGGG